jgi:hypothetical protein
VKVTVEATPAGDKVYDQFFAGRGNFGSRLSRSTVRMFNELCGDDISSKNILLKFKSKQNEDGAGITVTIRTHWSHKRKAQKQQILDKIRAELFLTPMPVEIKFRLVLIH